MSGQEWRDRARCRDMPTEFFFPERGDNVASERAKAFCQGCEVLAECREYAFSLPAEMVQGIWAGTGTLDRRAARRRKKPKGEPRPQGEVVEGARTA